MKKLPKKFMAGVIVAMMSLTVFSSTALAASNGGCNSATNGSYNCNSGTDKQNSKNNTHKGSQNNTSKDFTNNEMRDHINALKHSNNKIRLQSLFNDYQSKIAATKSAKSALLDAMEQAGLSIEDVDTSNGLNIFIIKSEIATITDSVVSDDLNRLLDIYQFAVKAESAARLALVSSMDKVIFLK